VIGKNSLLRTSCIAKLINETAKILGRSVAVSPTAVRVPVITGHGQAVRATFARDCDPNQARQILEQASGVRVVDDPAAGLYPMPVTAAGQDQVLVGRIRQNPFDPRSLNLWVVGDKHENRSSDQCRPNC
jgi:aspartate-semialdehyde dehydrogenase